MIDLILVLVFLGLLYGGFVLGYQTKTLHADTTSAWAALKARVRGLLS